MLAPYTRRRFLWSSSLATLAAQLPSISAADRRSETDAKLAKDGGSKAVQSRPARWVRWGEPEKRQLSAAVDQRSLFYWQGRAPNQQTALFVERFKRHCSAEHVVTCSSGTAALHIGIAAAGIAPGDEVITTPITDIGTVAGILFQQGVPVFADVGASTYNLDVQAVERCLSSKTKAIIAVHLAGTPCDVGALRALADERGLVLIEDCAQAWGARYRGWPWARWDTWRASR